MKLRTAVSDLRAKVDVDLDSERDLANDEEAVRVLMEGARRASEDTCCLWTWRAPIVLTADQPEYNTLDPDICSARVFEVWGVHLNGGWLQELLPTDFQGYGYETASSNSKPGTFVPYAPNNIRLVNPPNATCVAASDNFVIGFRHHAEYTSSSNMDDEMEGPEELHRLTVLRAALDATMGYVASEQGEKRWGLYEKNYVVRAEKLKKEMHSRFRQQRRRYNAGSEVIPVQMPYGW